MVTLPLNLTDGSGFNWDIQTDGSITNGTSDAFDGGLDLVGFPSSSANPVTDSHNGRQVEIGPVTVGNVSISRHVYVPDDAGQGWARFLETVTNNTGLTQNFTLTVVTDRGSDSATQILSTSSGDTILDATDTWIITDDGDGSAAAGDPVIGQFFGDGSLAPTSASMTGTATSTITFQLTLAPGESQSILHFASQNNTLVDASADQPDLSSPGAAQLTGLSQSDFQHILNYDFSNLVGPTTITGTAADDLLEGGVLDETISGLDGNDTILGGDGNDIIDAGGGDDLVLGGDGNDNIDGANGSDTIVAGDGNDLIDGGAGSDRIFAGAGNDTIAGETNLTQTSSNSTTIPSTAQSLAITLTGPDGSDAPTVHVDGLVSRSEIVRLPFNVAYIIDVSGSMDDPFSGLETVPDFNIDGIGNQLIDGAIQSFESLNQSFIDGNLGDNNVALITFSDASTTIFNGRSDADSNANGLTDIQENLRSINPTGGTNFEAALQQAILFFNSAPNNANRVFFISDGFSNQGGSFTDEVTTLLDVNGINAVIRSIGLGNGASLTQLDLVDDNTANSSAERVLEPSQLTTGLTDSPVTQAEIDRVEILVNGVLAATILSAELNNSPLGLQYSVDLTGLNISADDTILARVIATDVASTTVGTSLIIPNTPELVNGADLIHAGSGNDIVRGGGGNDTIWGGSGTDQLFGDAGNDRVNGNSGNDVVSGGSGNDVLFGGDGDDQIRGDADNDFLDGGAGIGSDRLDGGSGNDTATYQTAIAGVNVDLNLSGSGQDTGSSGIDTLISIENLTGSDHDDTLTGDGNANTLSGKGGFDVLNGDGGNDDLRGGDGNDTANGGDGADFILGEAGDDILFGNGDNDTLKGGLGIDKLRGNDGDDRLFGEDGADDLRGGSGADIIAGGADNDFILGEAGQDSLFGGAGNDTLRGGDDNDTLKGDDGNDILEGEAGDDRLFGGDGNDILTGASGIDTLYGDDGDDDISGGSSGDFLFGGKGNDIINGNSGSDNIRGNRGNDTLNGGASSDDLRAGGNNDTLNGDGGDDFLFGENGSDILFGGVGNDSLTGGLGGGTFDGATDTFIYADTGDGGGGFDRVKDFENGIDLIQLQAFNFANFAAVQALASNSGGGLRLDFGGGDVLFIENFSFAGFDAGDVLL